MRKYDFLIDKKIVSVYPMQLKDEDINSVRESLSDSAYAVCIYPVSDADYAVLCFDKNNREPREPHLPFAALSCFFRDVRGLPGVMFEVLYRGRRYELSASGNDYEFEVNVGKCKILCTKTVVYDDGITVVADAIDMQDTSLFVLCHDADLFESARLSSLPMHCGMELDSSVCALSLDTELRIKAHGSIQFYDAIAKACVILGERGTKLPLGMMSARVNGSVHRFLRSAETLTFYPEIKSLS